MSSTKPLPSYSRVNVHELPTSVPSHIARRGARSPVLQPGDGRLPAVPLALSTPTPRPPLEPFSPRPPVESPLLRPAPPPRAVVRTPQAGPADDDASNPFRRIGRPAVNFEQDALVRDVQKLTLTSTAMTDATELMEATPNPQAVSKFCNAFRRMADKLPQGEAAKQQKAQSVAEWLRNVNFVSIDEDLHDVILRKFAQGSKKVEKRGIQNEFAWLKDNQAQAITALLARRYTYQQLQGWLQNADSLTLDVRQALYPESFR